MNKALFVVSAVYAGLLTGACSQRKHRDPIVGAWLVHDFKAPFPMHMYVFNADGTMQQANPDAGDAHDSDGKGAWVADAGRVRGKWIEVMADRDTHAFTGRGEYAFQVTVAGDHLRGQGEMHLFDANGRPNGEIPTMFEGDRVIVAK